MVHEELTAVNQSPNAMLMNLALIEGNNLAQLEASFSTQRNIRCRSQDRITFSLDNFNKNEAFMSTLANPEEPEGPKNHWLNLLISSNGITRYATMSLTNLAIVLNVPGNDSKAVMRACARILRTHYKAANLFSAYLNVSKNQHWSLNLLTRGKVGKRNRGTHNYRGT